MRLKEAIKAMEERVPVVHKFGRDVTEYKHINSIMIKMECGEMKAVAELQDKKRENSTFTGYLDRIYIGGKEDELH